MNQVRSRERLVALLTASLVATSGCGAAVSAVAQPIEYNAVVVAGFCRLTPFCVERRSSGEGPRFYGFSPPGTRPACTASDATVDVPITDAITRDGQVRTLYCHNDEVFFLSSPSPPDPTRHLTGVVNNSRPVGHAPFPCFFARPTAAGVSSVAVTSERLRDMFGSNLTDSQVEASCPPSLWSSPTTYFASLPNALSCAANFAEGGATGPDLSAASWARLLRCNKSLTPPGEPGIVLDPTVAPHVGMSPAQLDEIARRYWGAVAHSYSEVAAINANFTIAAGNELSDLGPTASVRYIAFARPRPSQFPRVAAGPQQGRLRPGNTGPLDHNGNVLDWDPSIHPLGHTFDIDPSASVASVQELANPSNSSSSPVRGLASAFIHQASGNAEMSLLQAELTSSVTFSGHTITNGRMNLTSNWFGAISGAATSFAAIDAPVQIQFDVGADHYARNVTASTNIVGSYVSGVNPVFELDSSFVDGGLKFTVHLRLVGRKRPVATITSHAPSATPYTTECTSPAGASVSVAGVGTNVLGAERWRFLWSGGGLSRAGSTTTVQLPLLSPTSEPVHALFDYQDTASVHADTDRRRLRIVDSSPPSVSSTVVSPPCGFGIRQPSENAVLFNTCAPITGLFTDTCSTAFSVSIKKVRMYEYPSNAFLGEQAPQNNCILVHPSYVDAALSSVDYEVEYTAVDSWGNESPIRKWRGYFWGAGATGTCAAPAIAATLADQ